MMRVLLVAAVALSLGACGEKDQSLTGTSSKTDTQAFNGVKSPYQQAGWEPGNKTSWENQIRNRGQYQNEYNKTK